jgi:hypothetical protein
MSWLRITVPLLVAVLLAGPAAAAGADVCLVTEVREDLFVLKGLRLPKRPGDVVTVGGFGFTPVSGLNTLPLAGTLLRDPGGSGGFRMGLTRHFDRCLLGFNLTRGLTGTVNYDCNFDNSSDETDAVSVVDCAALGF